MSFKSENCSSERIYLTNLRLLGFTSEDKDVHLSQDMFDHPNQRAFHQVMHFLLKKLDPEKVKQEFRDCWPVLDKKQESEFRRKCSNWMKEIQRCDPEQFSHVNPALFQSPGGRKFVLFLRGFTKYVMSHSLTQTGVYQLKKPVCKKKELGKLVFNSLVERNQCNLIHSVRNQEENQDILDKAKPNTKTISQKYFELKTRKETLKKEIEEKKKKIEEDHGGEKKSYSVLSKEYKDRYSALKQRTDQLKVTVGGSVELAAEITDLTDSAVQRPSLDFTSLPQELIKDTDVLMTFDYLVQLGTACYRKCHDLPTVNHFAAAPVSEMEAILGNLSGQAVALRDLRTGLTTLKIDLNQSVEALARASQDIDWKTVFDSAADRESPELILLPPTPNSSYLQVASQGSAVKSSLKGSTVQHVQNTPEVITRLKLFSPITSAEQRNFGGKHLEHESKNLLNIPQDTTPANRSKGMKFSRKVTPDQKKLSRKITPDHSPLLKMTLIQSTMQRQTNTGGRLQEDSISSQVSESKVSLEVFSPGLCSTRLLKPEDLAAVPLKRQDNAGGQVGKDLVSGNSKLRTEDVPANSQHEVSNLRIKTTDKLEVLSDNRKSSCSEQLISSSEQLISSSEQLMSCTEQLNSHNTKPVSVEELCVNESSENSSVNNKIEMYKRFLQTAQPKSREPAKMVEKEVEELTEMRSEGETDPKISIFSSGRTATDKLLLDVWNKARESISPRTSPAFRRTCRLSNLGNASHLEDNFDASFTYNPRPSGLDDYDDRLGGGLGGGLGEALRGGLPISAPSSADNSLIDGKQIDMIGTRLEALMESLTLSDSGHDLSLGRMSFGEDLMLSPHCP